LLSVAIMSLVMSLIFVNVELQLMIKDAF
jgi:hypothetical protein